MATFRCSAARFFFLSASTSSEIQRGGAASNMQMGTMVGSGVVAVEAAKADRKIPKVPANVIFLRLLLTTSFSALDHAKHSRSPPVASNAICCLPTCNVSSRESFPSPCRTSSTALIGIQMGGRSLFAVERGVGNAHAKDARMYGASEATRTRPHPGGRKTRSSSFRESCSDPGVLPSSFRMSKRAPAFRRGICLSTSSFSAGASAAQASHTRAGSLMLKSSSLVLVCEQPSQYVLPQLHVFPIACGGRGGREGGRGSGEWISSSGFVCLLNPQLTADSGAAG